MSNVRSLKIIFFLSLLTAIILLIPKNTVAMTTTSSRTGKTNFLLIDDPQMFTVDVKEPSGENPEIKGRRFFTQYGNIFGIQDQQKELKLIEVSRSDDIFYFGKYKLGPFPTELPPFRPKTVRTHVKFQQMYNNIPVFAQEVFVHLEEGNIHSVSSEFTPNITLDSTSTKITTEQAREKAKQIWESEGKQAKYIGQPILYVFNPSALSPREDHNYLVWYVEIANSTTQPTEREFFFINAIDGNLVFRLPGIFEAKNIQVRDVGYDPGNQYPNDPENAKKFAGETYDYYYNKYGRDSFNGRGATIYVNARISGSCPNAYWNGSSINFCAGVATRDIVTHEFTHAITQYTANLNYSYQSGALNEGMSDIFGAAVDNDDWLMGEDSKLGAIRNMADPPNPQPKNSSYRRPQPDRLFSTIYYCGASDDGGVHINSGIPNKLAYLLAEGGTFNGCTISGIGREKEERIIYLALTKYLTSSSNFVNFYQSIKSACGELFGASSAECQNTENAAKAVEIDQEDSGSQFGAKCRGKTRVAPNCSATTPPPTGAPTATAAPTSGPTPTTPPGIPTNTPGAPTATNPPIPTPVNVSVWTSMMQNGQEVMLPSGSKVPIGTLISICYSRGGEDFTLTVDRGGGMIATYPKYFTDGGNPYGCLHSGDRRFFPIGELASLEGSLHTYIINNNNQTASTNLLITTGGTPPPGQPLPTNPPTGQPTSVPTNIPTATSVPQTPIPTPTTLPGQPTNTPAPTSTITPAPSPTSGPTPTGTSQSLQNLINSVSQDNIKDYLNHLVRKDDQVATENQTRYSTLQGHTTESDYAKSKFESFGLTTQFQSFGVGSGTSRNVIATLPGKNANQVYLITAHLDSTSSSRNPAPGADDNGSGSVLVMETARALKNSSLSFNSTIEFVLFSGEEQGLYGSKYYVSKRKSDSTLNNIKGVFNLDMVANKGAQGDCDKFGYRTYNGGNVLSQRIVDINNQYQINLSATSIPSSVTGSDHSPFWDENIPAIYGSECDFSPEYHKTSDQTDKINFDQLTKVAKAVTAAVASLAQE